jgi:hypothetical protein
MIKITIKNRFTGSVIFEYEKDKNTISETVKEYIRQELEKGNTSADLRYANLRYADLRSADLTSANLRSANLTSADLTSADLTSADLTEIKNKELANIPMFCKWSHSIKGDKIHIGCESRTIKEWDVFFKSDDIISTERGTDEFKQIQAVYLSYKAYLKHLAK